MVEWLGFFAGMCTTISFIPQVYRVWKTRSVQDISLSMYLMFCTGVVFWILYGVLKNAYPVILSNAITLILSFAILWMKVCWGTSLVHGQPENNKAPSK